MKKRKIKLLEFDDCKSVMSRIKKVYKFKKIKELANFLGVSPSVLSSRIQRNTMPADIILKCVMETGANPQWLCTGEGEPNIDGIKTEKKSIELSSEALEKLERIAALKSSGAITDDEYQLLKGNLVR